MQMEMNIVCYGTFENQFENYLEGGTRLLPPLKVLQHESLSKEKHSPFVSYSFIDLASD